MVTTGGGVSALQETDLTGPISIYKLLPEVTSGASAESAVPMYNGTFYHFVLPSYTGYSNLYWLTQHGFCADGKCLATGINLGPQRSTQVLPGVLLVMSKAQGTRCDGSIRFQVKPIVRLEPHRYTLTGQKDCLTLFLTKFDL